MSTTPVDRLAATLFEGEYRASDIKMMPGTRSDLSSDELAVSLLRSMERVGLVKNSRLVDMNGSDNQDAEPESEDN